MNTNPLIQIKYLIKHNLKCEFAAKERLFSSLLFASTILIIFNFAFAGKIASDYSYEIFLAEVFVTLLLTMQLNFLRQFDIECEDNALDSLRLNPISSYSLYLGKYLVSLIMSTLILLPTLLLAFFFHGAATNNLVLNFQFLAVLSFVMLGLSCLGCLISALIQKMNAREAIYPLLFYPLSVPLLIVGLQACYKSLLSPGGWELTEVLLGLDLIYFLLSLLLFDEIMH